MTKTRIMKLKGIYNVLVGSKIKRPPPKDTTYYYALENAKKRKQDYLKQRDDINKTLKTFERNIKHYKKMLSRDYKSDKKRKL